MKRSFRFQLALRFAGTIAAGLVAISAMSLFTLRVVLDRELDASVLNVASIQAASVTDSPLGGMTFHEWQLTPDEAAALFSATSVCAISCGCVDATGAGISSPNSSRNAAKASS